MGKAVPGILKEVAVLLCLICMVCAMCAPPHLKQEPLGEWYIFVCMTAFWVTLVLLIMYLFHAIEKFHVIPWLMIEFGYCAVWAFFFFTSSLAFAVEGASSPALAAGAFFGFLCTLVYAVDSFFKFRGWRKGQLAQGERKVTETQSHHLPTY